MIDARTSRTAGSWITPLWRGLIVFRIAALVYATILVTYNHRYLARPGVAAAALVGMILWTALMSYTNGYARYRRWWWSAADLTVATAVLLLTPYVDKHDGLLARNLTLTGPWTWASVLSCAILGGPWVGLLASLPIIAASIALPGGWINANTLDNLVLIVAAGSVGLVVRLLDRVQLRTRQLVELEATTAERERLSRSIHDGVLQVLTLMQRHGPELGPQGAELARRAGEQEASLRALMTRDGPPEPPAGPAELDLRLLLGQLGLAAGHLSVPAAPVLLPRQLATELCAAAAAAVDNARRHAGPQARIWVAIEDDPAEVTVTVRDDGVGIPDGRLAEAAASGRLGVAQSIQGRLTDLGGKATVTSRPGDGTEVECRVPRPARDTG
jgi:signal transduction histidine kinase